eukprot:8170704-Pyramimonas_sp.AAC.1
MKPTRWGPELEVVREPSGTRGASVSELARALAKRVDDFKIAGRKGRVDRPIGRVEGVFGRMRGDCDDDFA